MSKLNKQEAVSFILEEANIAWEQFSTIFNCGKIPEVEIISKPTRYAGIAYRSGKKVSFNIPFCMIEGSNFIRTIRHELAHVIQCRLFPNAAQAHGKEFRYILESLGFESKTYHTYDTRVAKSLAKKTKVLLIDSISAEEM